ncbi:hypothetical protein DRE_01168 [Drechslerella stenobrocha 248]|uniref:FAD-binding PCMH-type domain-containing protein n=1 Tax=Drechslerella stenobrocha 248 TaxID=1043628 RepID=W7HW95_9PEZI|nr:hypothetical protein DRE_01168 [Drechslerella stenobrocha 248]
MADFSTFSSGLKPRLSAEARIVGSEGTVTRWDESSTPVPHATVFPTTEEDVAETVKYCREKGLKCFAQSGGHGWRVRNSRDINVIISLGQLNTITIAEDQKSVTLGGGTIIKQLIESVAAEKLEVVTGICNTVGVLGSLLQGGIGRYMGKYGLGIDNLLSVNLVDATGTLHRNVNESTDADLWWSIRGAGTSFGIVTEATIKAYPQASELSWIGSVAFTNNPGSKIEKIVKAIQELEVTDKMCLHLLFACAPPAFTPAVLIMPWYYGSEEEGRKAWKGILDLEPDIVDMTMAPAERLNDGNDPFGEVGGRKPGVGMGLEKIDPDAYCEIWRLFEDFVTENPQAARSIVLLECYSKAKSLSVPRETTAFANRDIKYETIVCPWYEDPTFDIKANAFSSSIREIWSQKCSHPDGRKRVYTAFSGNNEPTESLFGERERVDKLKAVKAKWDPENYWGALFDI